MYKISVIIPIYNVEKYLKRCLDSVLNQTIKDIEIICIDDESTDSSRKILETYRQYDNIKIIYQKNAGIPFTRNRGIKEATGEFIAFLDSDDYIDSDYYENLYINAVKYNAEIACGSFIRENEKDRKILLEYKEIKYAEDIQEKFYLAKSPEYNFVWNKIYKRNLFYEKNLSFISHAMFEDMYFIPDSLELASSLVTVPNSFYHYWKHKNSFIKRNSDRVRADKIKANKYLIDKCKKYCLKDVNKENLISKEVYNFLGLKILKVKKYEATKKYYLLGFIKFLEIKEDI